MEKLKLFHRSSRTLLLLSFHSHLQPRSTPKGCIWWRLDSTEKIKHRSVAAEAEHISMPGAAERTPVVEPCQRDSEPLPFLPAADGANWEHHSLCVARCKTFISGHPACSVMPDILHVCCTGISISHLSESEGHRITLNKAMQPEGLFYYK